MPPIDFEVYKSLLYSPVPIQMGGTAVQPGDIIFGDLDGVVVIPQHCEVEVLKKTVDKARAENEVRKEIEGGLSSTRAFVKYEIL